MRRAYKIQNFKYYFWFLCFMDATIRIGSDLRSMLEKEKGGLTYDGFIRKMLKERNKVRNQSLNLQKLQSAELENRRDYDGTVKDLKERFEEQIEIKVGEVLRENEYLKERNRKLSELLIDSGRRG